MKLQTIFETELYKTHRPTRKETTTDIKWKRLKFLRQNLARAAGRKNPQVITVTLDEAYSIGINQEWKDPFTGEDLEFERGGEWGMKNAFGTGASNPRSCSIDRIDSSQGYIPGNIQLVTAKTNVSKGNMNNKEFIEYCKKVADYHK
jgi:hypothetical protein